MTTHFTSGVTNVATGGTGEKLKLPDPIKYHVYHEDFDKYTASDWVITTTEGGSGDATEALGDGDGGLLVVIAPVVAFLVIKSKPFSDRTGPENVVFAIIVSS